jgi:hypothetical protein
MIAYVTSGIIASLRSRARTAVHAAQSTWRAKLIGMACRSGHSAWRARSQPGMRTQTTSIEPDRGHWLGTFASGERLPLRIDSGPATGVIDYVMLPAPDVEARAHTRVIPHAAGALYTFSMHQTPDIHDEFFDAQVSELEREMTVLKAHLETACPP